MKNESRKLKRLWGVCLLGGLMFSGGQAFALKNAGRNLLTLPSENGFQFFALSKVGLKRSFFSPNSIYLVNSTLDTSDAVPGDNACSDGAGNCTLRAAIQEANAHAGADLINFGIASGLQTINAASDLPIITEPVTIDGTTQPGFAGAPLIEVSGTSSSYGFDVSAGNTVVRGLILNRWDTAIQLDVSGGNVIEGCYIGTDAAGANAVANRIGITVRSNNNRIGGTTAAERNVISGNTVIGVHLNGGGSNLVQGNYIGTNAAGNAVIGGLPASPSGTGIEILGADFNTIGGTAAGAGNVVTGNRNANILVRSVVGLGAPTNGNIIQGNRIGLDAFGGTSGTQNTRGIYVDSATNTQIGGANPAARNIVSGHFSGLVSGGAIWIVGGANATGTIVQGNFIGTDASGATAVGNAGAGILIAGNNTQIGGTAANAGNLISGGSGSGVRILSPNNTVQGNFIGTNAAGDADLGNNQHGISVESGTNNIIGGASAEAKNLISGNNQNGVVIRSGASTTTVTGNLIGTDASGNADLGNSEDGVWIDNSPSNTVGAAFAQSAVSTISGNDLYGVRITGTSATNNIVQGNRIGTNASGTAALRNERAGVVVAGGASSNKIGDLTATPGTAPGNLISGQDGALFAYGVWLFGSGTRLNAVFGNLIGTDISGTSAIPNHSGVVVGGGATHNFIGEKLLEARNLISGNSNRGVDLVNAGTSDNQVQGNFIGTNITGTAALANPIAGVVISNSASGNFIGGSVAGSRNLISGNGRGVYILVNADNNFVQSNFIGTNAAGTAAVPNTISGIVVQNAVGNLIGGTQALAGNVISGNSPHGIHLVAGANNNTIRGNLIGLAADGSTPLGNAQNGIQVGDASMLVAPSTGNIIGGTGANEGNKISGNNGNGVFVINASTTSIFSNVIFNNSALGIDLSASGVTANDACDGDGGANLLQNFPVIAAAQNIGGATDISGSLNSQASATFTVQLFINDACDSTMHGEGQTLIDTFTFTTDTACQASFSRTISPAIAPGRFITATATDSAGNTSEFSLCRQVTVPTAAVAAISGRVVNAEGRGVWNARLTLTDSAGETRYAQTNPFGYYRFVGMPAGRSYVISVSSKQHTFAPSTLLINLLEEMENVNFTAAP